MKYHADDTSIDKAFCKREMLGLRIDRCENPAIANRAFLEHIEDLGMIEILDTLEILDVPESSGVSTFLNRLIIVSPLRLILPLRLQYHDEARHSPP